LTAVSGNPEQGRYRIGAVSRMTGIALPTLRMWERRYQLVDPERTPAGGRLYNREHIARLSLLHAAVQAGHAIGTVAHLSDEDLQARVRDARVSSPAQIRPVRLAVVGPELPGLLAGSASIDPSVEMVASAPAIPAEGWGGKNPAVDVLLLELPTLQEDELDTVIQLIRRTEARMTLVVYGFTSRKFLRRLDLLDVLCIRAPADIPQLMHLVRLGGVVDNGQASTGTPIAEVAAPLTEQQLERLRQISSGVQCECPQQLAMLISTLVAFERYTQGCAAETPADAALHGRLSEASEKARRGLERALRQLLKAEGIALSP
jgi:MerR family transcriptional regulator, light-induced transcriptional regulator